MPTSMKLSALAGALGLCLGPSMAEAHLIDLGQVALSGQGFGNIVSILEVHSVGNDPTPDTEAGDVSPVGVDMLGALPGGGVDWPGCLPKAIGSGLAVGFLTGLFGVGGGFLIVPALVLLLGLPMTVAVGTSLFIIVVNSAAGFAAHAGATRAAMIALGS